MPNSVRKGFGPTTSSPDNFTVDVDEGLSGFILILSKKYSHIGFGVSFESRAIPDW